MSSVLPASAAQASLEMRSIIQRIATGPELSKDITADEARSGMRAILEGVVDPVQAAIFLIALRMKRETDEENKGLLDGIRDHTETVTADVDEVVDIAEVAAATDAGLVIMHTMATIVPCPPRHCYRHCWLHVRYQV